LGAGVLLYIMVAMPLASILSFVFLPITKITRNELFFLSLIVHSVFLWASVFLPTAIAIFCPLLGIGIGVFAFVVLLRFLVFRK
jgi:hypothetical protein